MNNFNFLNIVNPQISYAIDSGIKDCDNKYMVCIPAVLGYNENMACSLFLAINEKLMPKSSNDALERLYNDMLRNPGVLLDGYDDFVLGEDYFLSESLYDWLMYTYPEPDDDDVISASVRPTTISFLNKKPDVVYEEKITITNTGDVTIVPNINTDELHEYFTIKNNVYIQAGHGNDIIVRYNPKSGGVHNCTFSIEVNGEITTINIIASAIDEFNEFHWPTGYTIVHGIDVNMLLNLNKYNKYIIGEILTEKYLSDLRSDYNKYKCPRDLRPPLVRPEIEEDSSSDSSEDDILPFVMNDYIIFNPDLTFKQDLDCYKRLFDINIKDMRNLEWFYLKNRFVMSDTFTEDEICNIPNSFFKIIYEYGTVQNPETLKNQIYDLVSKYFMNGQTDALYRGLNLLLSSTVPNQNNNKLNCGCASDGLYGNLNEDSLISCADLYKTSMLEWLKNMLSDSDYYKDWFFTINTAMCPEPNEPMIDLLIKLLTDFLNHNYDSFVKIGNKKLHLTDHFCCDNVETNDTIKNAILDYIKLLNIVKNNEIDSNNNKIKVWGAAFAEILPNLVC